MPYVAYEVADILWDSVMFVDLNSFSDTTGVPVFLWGYDFRLFPINNMIQISRVFDNCRFVKFPSAAMSYVFFKPGSEVSASLANDEHSYCKAPKETQSADSSFESTGIAGQLPSKKQSKLLKKERQRTCRLRKGQVLHPLPAKSFIYSWLSPASTPGQVLHPLPAKSSIHSQPSPASTPGQVLHPLPAKSSIHSRPSPPSTPGQVIHPLPAKSSIHSQPSPASTPGQVIHLLPAKSSIHSRPSHPSTPSQVLHPLPAKSSIHSRPSPPSTTGQVLHPILAFNSASLTAVSYSSLPVVNFCLIPVLVVSFAPHPESLQLMLSIPSRMSVLHPMLPTGSTLDPGLQDASYM
ncbi:putative protein FAM47C [Patiria miniata]|uniref:Uncharacterized protein n=1 Tax=Patiria miniata TaxID=46514 RepID=A0A914BNY4_PATMI|nr:putative protein FAM47C [Patiria miniata]